MSKKYFEPNFIITKYFVLQNVYVYIKRYIYNLQMRNQSCVTKKKNLSESTHNLRQTPMNN